MFRLEDESKWMQMAASASNTHTYTRLVLRRTSCSSPSSYVAHLCQYICIVRRPRLIFFCWLIFCIGNNLCGNWGKGLILCKCMQISVTQKLHPPPRLCKSCLPNRRYWRKGPVLPSLTPSLLSLPPGLPHIQPSPLKLFPVLPPPPSSPLEFFPYALVLFFLSPRF